MSVVTLTKFDHDAFKADFDGWKKGMPLVRAGDYYVTTRYDLDTMTEDERTDLFRHLVDGHDFYFEMSDDHSVWKSGRRSLDRIRTVGRTLPKDLTNQIWFDKFGEYAMFSPLFSE